MRVQRVQKQKSPVHFFLKIHVSLHLLFKASVYRFLLLCNFLGFLLFNLHLDQNEQLSDSSHLS